MITDDIRKKIRHIEIYTKRLLSGTLVGDSRSALKGSGFEFDQIREYQIGDDVRFIDWKSSARSGKLLVKQYVEERSRTVILVVDISASSYFSSCAERKIDIFQQIAATLAIVAEYGRDKISLLLFSDEVELFIPPGHGRAHTRAVLEALFSHTPKKKRTRLAVALERLAALKRSDSLVFLISDFIGDDLEPLISIVAKKYDLVAVRSLDKHETELPDVGFLPIEDSETGQQIMLDTTMRSRKRLQGYFDGRIAQQKKLFRKHRVDCLELLDNQTLVADTVRFFKRRMMY